MVRFSKIPTDVAELCEESHSFCEASALYRVKVNGQECGVHRARVSAVPFNRTWPGHQRPLDQTEMAAFICFEADEPVTVEAAYEGEIREAVMRPLSRQIEPQVSGQVMRFTLPGKGQYVLEPAGEHFALHIFVNEPKEYEEAGNATYVFGPGTHFPGLIRLRSGDSVYVDREAVVYGSFLGEHVRDVRIFGGGIIDGSHEERIIEHCYRSSTKGNLKFYDSRNLRVEGVVLRNSPIWVISLFGCEDVVIDNVKIVGQWRYNTDGIDICNCSNVAVRDSFIRSFDDTITIKGIPAYEERPVKHIHVSGCVMWCGWGRNAEIGIETYAPEYDDIVFEDCDLIHSSAACLDIQNGGFAHVHNVRFLDIRVEYAGSTLPEVYQHREEQVYDGQGKTGMPWLIFADNYQLPLGGASVPYGRTEDVLYRNIQVYLEEGLPAPKIHLACQERREDAEAQSVLPAPKIHLACRERREDAEGQSVLPEDCKEASSEFTVDGLFINGKRVAGQEELEAEGNVRARWV